jgi:phasin family protein
MCPTKIPPNPYGENIMTTTPLDLFKPAFSFASLVANTTFDGIERLAALNLTASRSVMDVSLANFNALLGAKDVASFVSLQKELAKPSIEKSVEYSRNVIAIAGEAKEKIAKEVEVQVAETNAKVAGMVEKALASAPAGSEVAVAAVKTAIKTANEAYEGVNKAAKQAVEVAEASVTAAAKATIKATNVAAAKAA